ncbi:MAG: 4-(cytidine 5'-diphospho)-2-C-methyl-D-erythritol kinase, partial [SAR202 cluster bacterium]|nr:4-(cytidine 5'-diphospho)-2-C-methyl-D-erythritol kinase [SAR202 cluster bacterium]
MLTLDAHAKINLTLEILGRRDDGYHEIVSVIQTISLCDTVSIDQSDSLEMECDIEGLDVRDNLAYRAALLLKERSNTALGARINIQKRIPVSAGLGGGSADAAAVLIGLNQHWELGLSIDELKDVASRLGSDVPFLLNGGTAMLTGRGERVRTLPPVELPWLVLLCPEIEVENKTATMYSNMSSSSYTRGALTRKLEARIRGGGDAPAQFFFNVFDDVARHTVSGLDDYWQGFEALGAREIHVAGSGPTLFA